MDSGERLQADYFAMQTVLDRTPEERFAKGLAAGYWPIAMVGMTRRISSAFADRDVDFVHAHTFENHVVGCAAALAVLNQVRAFNLSATCLAITGICALEGSTSSNAFNAMPSSRISE